MVPIMRDASETVDAYLTNRFGIGLERLLTDATSGRPNRATSRAVEIACDPVGSFAYEDGGTSELFQGILTIEGVIYRFRCTIFTDAGAARFVESGGEVEAVSWGVRLAVPPRSSSPKRSAFP